MVTKTQLVSALRKEFPDLMDRLEVVRSTRRILGWVASDRFDMMDHGERQDLLWYHLHKEFGADALEHVGPIATLTLDEARVDV